MSPELPFQEKLTRIWSQRRHRYVLFRVRYARDASRAVLQLLAIEELDGRY